MTIPRGFLVVLIKFTLPQEDQDIVTEDAKELLSCRPYHWKDWCIARGRDCLYIWSDAAALELSNGSNGWFRFILDGKLATMYSSGSPEGGSDSSGKRVFILMLLTNFVGWTSLISSIDNGSILTILSTILTPNPSQPVHRVQICGNTDKRGKNQLIWNKRSCYFYGVHGGRRLHSERP